MNSKRAVLFFVSALVASRVCEGWSKRERELVNRSGIVQLHRRRTKDEKEGKKDKKEKKDKKDSKQDKSDKSGKSSFNAAHIPNHDHTPIVEGLLDEDVVGDFDDIYEGFFQRHFSFGSMSMGYAQPLSASQKMLTPGGIESHYRPTDLPSKMFPEPTSYHMEYDSKMIMSLEDDRKISFDLYSLIFSFVDSVLPTRREDYNELVTATNFAFKDFMIRSYESNSASKLNDFQTEFVRTGVSELNEIFVVFQSTATFDSDSYSLPEQYQVQDSLRDALARHKDFWMEYITVLQELNPDNAFSSTINVKYMNGIPNERGSMKSTSSSMADTIAYSAAAGITVLSIIAFIATKSRDQREVGNPLSQEKNNTHSIGHCGSTVSETLTYEGSLICGEQNQYGRDKYAGSDTTENSTHASSEYRGFVYNCGSSSLDSEIDDDCVIDDLPVRGSDSRRFFRSRAGTLGYVQHGHKSAITNTSTTPEAHIVHDISRKECSPSNRKLWYSSQERHTNPKQRSASKVLHQEERATLFDENCSSKNDGNSKPFSNRKPHLEEHRMGHVLRDRSAQIEEGRPTIERTILARLLRNEKKSLLDENKRESQEMLRAELAVIKAEAAARTADELRLKEERRLALDRESLKKQSKLREYGRRAKALDLRKSKH